MKGFLGFLTGSLILRTKAMPRLLASPLVGAVRGMFVNTWEEIRKFDARQAEFDAKYMREMEEESAQLREKRRRQIDSVSGGVPR